jgi:hypothetical protein
MFKNKRGMGTTTILSIYFVRAKKRSKGKKGLKGRKHNGLHFSQTFKTQ